MAGQVLSVEHRKAAIDEPADRGRESDFGGVSYTMIHAWVKVGDRLAEEWVKEVTAKGYPGQEMLDSARALIAKHSK